EPYSTISATRTSSTPSDTPSFHPTGSATSGEIRLAPAAGTAGRNWRGPAHLKRAWMCVLQKNFWCRERIPLSALAPARRAAAASEPEAPPCPLTVRHTMEHGHAGGNLSAEA